MKMNGLSYMQAKALPTGKYNDGRGLWLHKKRKDHGRWFLRISIEGKRREMGLGRWPDVGIAEAREKATEARQKVREGIDPVDERQKLQMRGDRVTVAKAIAGCFKARQAQLKGDGQAGRWLSPLNTHVIPALGDTPIEEIDQHVIVKLLEPLWHDKASVSEKIMSRLNLTIQHAAALGLDVDLQATMKAKALLGKQRVKVKHIPSLPYAEIPKFYQWLCTQKSITTYALRFLILTVTRTGEVRFAKHEEVKEDVWTIPADRTKTNKENRIPLTDEALRVIELATQLQPSEYLFPSPQGKALSNMALSMFMRREGYKARPHGFRATFRTWAEEQTEADYAVMEASLGHAVDKGVVGAYQRGDRLEKRSTLLSQWGNFLTA